MEEKFIIKIKYHSDDLPRLNKIDVGDWIDLRASQDVDLDPFEFSLIPLGVSIELPKGWEAHVVPRSSTFKKFGVIQTNHMGIIDSSYNGDDDQWMFPALAIRKTSIKKGDRICQFRITENQPDIVFHEVDFLGNKNRGGFGSTG